MFIAVARWVIQALPFGNRGVQAPQNLRIQSNRFYLSRWESVVAWDAPRSWGNDRGGTVTRGYQSQVRQILTASGARPTGGAAAWQSPRPADITGTDTNASTTRTLNLIVNTVYEMRVRAVNADGDKSEWAVIEVHGAEHNRFLVLDYRYLRVGTRRLRLA